jgi:SPX domain protein involved in polyphosphate accumulation
MMNIKKGGQDSMKTHEVIRWLSKLSPDEHIIINWWTHQDIIDTGGNSEVVPDLDVTWNEWKQIVNTINGSQDWDYIQDAAIEEACNIVARRQDLFKDESGLRNDSPIEV